MASRLTPCPSCSRHVKVGPPSCPFCGGSVPTDVPARAMAVGRPLSRAALLFAGAASAAACSGAQSVPSYGTVVLEDSGSADDALSDGGTGDDATVAADAGQPDGGGSTAHDASDDLGQSSADYGVFVNPDGG